MVAGVLVGDRPGEVRIFRRGPGLRHAGLWEFPGGKIEPGEAPEAALARELDEELRVQARIGRRLWAGRDPGPPAVEVAYYEAFIEAGQISLVDHDAVRSVHPAEPGDVPWAPVDGAFVDWLVASRGD